MKKIFKKLFLIIFLVILIIFVSILGITYKHYNDAKEELAVIDVYDYIKSTKVNYTEYDDIDKDFINAIVSVEDRRFFKREGIDYIALARAILVNLESQSLREGGSTITQQLIQNVYFGFDFNFFDRLAEYLFIYDFENSYTKEEILEMYANIINYGDGNFCIYDAAMNYFKKEPNDLSIYEASLLAGIPNSPANYQLSNNNPNTYIRQTHVLEAMLEEGYISYDEFNEAISLQPTF